MTSLYLGRHLFQLSQNRTRDLQERNFPGLDTEPNYIDPIDKTLSGIQNNQHANTIIKTKAAELQSKYRLKIGAGTKNNPPPIVELGKYVQKNMIDAQATNNPSINKRFIAILNKIEEVMSEQG